MKVIEIMEKVNLMHTGRALSYIKDALEEMAIKAPTHTHTVRYDINKDQRFYTLPNEATNILDVRCKHHENNSDLYKSIPRSIYEPGIEDTDGK